MLKIRLRRMGKTHAPFYRVVVSDSRRTPTASAVEEVGHYNPRPTPPDVKIQMDRVQYWQSQGALLSPTVRKLINRIEAGKLDDAVAGPGAEAPAAEAKPAAKPAAKTEAKAEAKAEAEPKAEAAEETPAAEAAAEASEEKADG